MGKREVWFISARRHSETGAGREQWGDGRGRRQGVQTRAGLRRVLVTPTLRSPPAGSEHRWLLGPTSRWV